MNLYTPVSSLDEYTRAKAHLELNESKNKEDVEKDILAIRELLIANQVQIKSRIDDGFILSFLRAAKFNHKKTLDSINHYWHKRIGLKVVFYNRCLENNSKLLKIAELGLLLPLLKLDEEKRRVVIQRPGLWNTSEFTYEDMITYFFLCMDILCEDPINQINGTVFLIDLTNLNKSHVSNMTPSRAFKFLSCLRDAFPSRLKAIHYYNYPGIIEPIFGIVKIFLKKKLRDRLYFHGSNLESIQKDIPKGILTKEYGGTEGSFEEMNEKWTDYLKNRLDFIKSLDNYGVNI